jgi:hypothetical protein
MTTEQAPIQPVSQQPKKRTFPRWIAWIAVVGIVVFLYLNVGLFTIQPIGAVPEGITLVLWRNPKRPFFDSADRLCMDVQGGVTLLCRVSALGALTPENIRLYSK